jgi:hypothetical protein
MAILIVVLGVASLATMSTDTLPIDSSSSTES